MGLSGNIFVVTEAFSADMMELPSIQDTFCKNRRFLMHTDAVRSLGAPGVATSLKPGRCNPA